MGRRSRDSSAESTFGSDSFLDVVANIVGILIILIVIVGVRIKHSSPASAEKEQQKIEADRESWQAAKEAIERANEEAKSAYEKQLADRETQAREQEEAKQAHESALAARENAEKLHEQERRRREKILAEYEAEAQRLAAEMNDLSKQLQIARAERNDSQKRAQDRLVSLDTQIDRAQQQEASLQSQRQQLQAKLAASQQESSQWLRQVEELRRKLAEITRTMPVTKPLKHYATPMARVVRKSHVFFHCKGGRISYAYFDELMNMARDQARSRMTPSSSRIEGVVGPLGGFRMKYVYVRTGLSMTEQLSGPMAVSYSIGQIILKLEEEPVGETVDQVFNPNSSFRIRLRSLAADKQVVTLWVYGDSFSLAKEVEEYLHEAGFDVVMMPLPDGHPVSLGPNGFSMDAR
jgi:hypothetical protein